MDGGLDTRDAVEPVEPRVCVSGGVKSGTEPDCQLKCRRFVDLPRDMLGPVLLLLKKPPKKPFFFSFPVVPPPLLLLVVLPNLPTLAEPWDLLDC